MCQIAQLHGRELCSSLAIRGRQSSYLLQESFKRSFGDISPEKISNPLWLTSFLFSIFGDKAIWGNWNPTRIGLTHCNIKPNLHNKKKMLIWHPQWKKQVLISKGPRGVVRRFKNHHIKKKWIMKTKHSSKIQIHL